MHKVLLLAFLILASCSSISRSGRYNPSPEHPPRVSSGSLGKNIDELNAVVNNSLSRLDKIIANLGGK